MERRFSTAVVCSMIICRAITNMRTSNMVSFLGLHKSLKNSMPMTISNILAIYLRKAPDSERVCSGSDVLYIPTDNTAASCTEIIKNIAVPAKKPIIAGEEGICSGCGVATLSISYYDLGYETGKMAAEILTKGTDVSTMEVQSAPKVTKEYNAEICKELNIKVPDGYTAIAE